MTEGSSILNGATKLLFQPGSFLKGLTGFDRRRSLTKSYQVLTPEMSGKRAARARDGTTLRSHLAGIYRSTVNGHLGATARLNCSPTNAASKGAVIEVLPGICDHDYSV